MGFVITGVINLCFEMTNEGEDEKAQVYTAAPRVQCINKHCTLGIKQATDSWLSLLFLARLGLR